MGVTLGVLQNANGWWGEGNDMIFIDDESKPAIVGTGLKDYFLGSWDFGGRDGAPLIVNAPAAVTAATGGTATTRALERYLNTP